MRRGSERQGWLSKLRRGSFGLAALFAIALQVFVVQTHVHALGAAHAALTDVSHEATAHALDGAAGEAQRSCLICQALAEGGRMLPPGAAQIVRADGRDIVAAAPDIPFVSVAPSHSWQSRAPPIAL